MIYCAFNEIVSLIGNLLNGIVCVVNDINIIAAMTDHCVSASKSVQTVFAIIPC